MEAGTRRLESRKPCTRKERRARCISSPHWASKLPSTHILALKPLLTRHHPHILI